MKNLLMILLCCFLTAAVFAQDDAFEFRLKAPVNHWDEAAPIGNGIAGCLIWGEGRIIRVSIDKEDLWELNYPELFDTSDWSYSNMQKLVKNKDQKKIVELFDEPYGKIPYPTKLPGFRLELELPEGESVSCVVLKMKEGVSIVELKSGKTVRFVMKRNEPAFFVESQVALKLSRILGPGDEREDKGTMPYGNMSDLKYPALVKKFNADGGIALQQTAGKFAYGTGFKPVQAIVEGKADANSWLYSGVIASTTNSFNIEEYLNKSLDLATANDLLTTNTENANYWDEFWAVSSVTLPDVVIQRMYLFAQYLYGAGSRKGYGPIALQGLWTADTSALPPWKGDYHFDLNVQLTYWPAYAAGHLEESASLTDFMLKLKPSFRNYASKFYGTGGLNIPGVMSYDGQAMGGWGQYSLSPVQGIWATQNLYWQWKYSGDETFLMQDAYPFMKEVAENVSALLKKDKDGFWIFPLSASPEIFDNSLRAWQKPNTNYDNALLMWFFTALEEMSDAASLEGESAKWKEMASYVHPLYTDKQNILMFSTDEKFKESHRHHSHLMGIYPLRTISIHNSESEKKTILSSLDKLKQKGSKQWTGYSFSWASCLEANAGRGNEALNYLDIFCNAFVLRNGFHVNGDQSGKGYSSFTYRPFTLEGNFAAAEAVHQMLFQSEKNSVRIFPACPDKWKDVSFENILTENGLKVSAVRKAGLVTSITIEATRNCQDKILIYYPTVKNMNVEFAGISEPLKMNENLIEFVGEKGTKLTITAK